MIPSFIEITNEKVHDVSILDENMPETGSINIIDHTDIDFSTLHVLTQCSTFFVTRAKSDISEYIKKGRIQYQVFLLFEFSKAEPFSPTYHSFSKYQDFFFNTIWDVDILLNPIDKNVNFLRIKILKSKKTLQIPPLILLIPYSAQ